jgi:dienelactone hydrolase
MSIAYTSGASVSRRSMISRHTQYQLIFALVLLLCGYRGTSNAQSARMEIYAIDTVTLTGEQFLTGDRNGKPTRIGGELRLPSAGTAKVPAVLLVHGSGGVRTNIDLWATQLVSMGIATFVLDTFTGRGIVTTSEDQSQLHSLAMLYDSYRSLDLLAKHARIDGTRIAIMGFSKGAVAAVYSSVARFNKMHGTPSVTFAAHIGFYTPCNTKFLDETVVTGKPIRLFHGISDDLVQIGPCRAFTERLRAAGRDAKLTEYQNAWHVFDSPGPALVDRKGQNGGACRNEEREGGQIINTETGKPYSSTDRCVTQDAHTGYSPNAHAASIRDVGGFLNDTFSLKH